MMMLGTVSAMRGTCSGSRTSDALSPTASAPKNVALGIAERERVSRRMWKPASRHDEIKEEALALLATLDLKDDARTRVQDLQRALQEAEKTPGPSSDDTRKAADFLAGVFQRDGIRVERYESAPGKAILYARLKATVSPPAGKPITALMGRSG